MTRGPMRPIRKGDRGPAVEDVQRRLRVLGADLGPTGIDGVFLGATLAAVQSFQRQHVLAEDGEVGPATWAALVDATFSLGDRLLYLHAPHFHGADVRILQGALNVLGFAAGEPDGIFGAYTERAVREFQANAGLPADGIIGPDTVRALSNLRHVWADKAPEALGALRRAPARSAGVLSRRPVFVVAADTIGLRLAERLQNLALASNPDACVEIVDGSASGDSDPRGVSVHLGAEFSSQAAGDVPTVVAGDGGDALARRLEVGMRSSAARPLAVRVVLGALDADEHTAQRVAVGLLDGVCLGLAAAESSVLT
jgi:peptidoglycan hydrolase-like protein with peptidoglycan-binding domain